MRKYFIYFMIYSFCGFLLERILNYFYFGTPLDNSVLVGPYQPLYGVGIILAIIFYDLFLKRMDNKPLKYLTLLFVTLGTTAFSEAFHGYGYQFLAGNRLWDYNMFFSCSIPYVCLVPTSLFGFLSFLVIVFVHPFIKTWVKLLPGFIRRWVFRILLILFVIDLVYTLIFRVIEL